MRLDSLEFLQQSIFFLESDVFRHRGILATLNNRMPYTPGATRFSDGALFCLENDLQCLMVHFRQICHV